MRVAVLKEDNCQPKKCMDECMTFCPPVRNGQECVVMMNTLANLTSQNHFASVAVYASINVPMMH